jgi:hypothetical protein
LDSKKIKELPKTGKLFANLLNNVPHESACAQQVRTISVAGRTDHSDGPLAARETGDKSPL